MRLFELVTGEDLIRVAGSDPHVNVERAAVLARHYHDAVAALAEGLATTGMSPDLIYANSMTILDLVDEVLSRKYGVKP